MKEYEILDYDGIRKIIGSGYGMPIPMKSSSELTFPVNATGGHECPIMTYFNDYSTCIDVDPLSFSGLMCMNNRPVFNRLFHLVAPGNIESNAKKITTVHRMMENKSVLITEGRSMPRPASPDRKKGFSIPGCVERKK